MTADEGNITYNNCVLDMACFDFLIDNDDTVEDDALTISTTIIRPDGGSLEKISIENPTIEEPIVDDDGEMAQAVTIAPC